MSSLSKPRTFVGKSASVLVSTVPAFDPGTAKAFRRSKPARLLHRFHSDLRGWSIAPCNGYCNSGSHDLQNLCDVLVGEARAKDDCLDALFLDKGSADFQCLSLTFDQSYVEFVLLRSQ